MAGEIHEWFGYQAEVHSPAAESHAENTQCPFVERECKKKKIGGVCSIRQSSGSPVIVCPIRLYGNGYRFLSDIAEHAFGTLPLHRGPDGRPVLVKGSEAGVNAAGSHMVQVGVFGQNWDREVRLPSAVEGGASYSVDFTIVAVTPEQELVGFAPIEVQTIDTTNSYSAGVAALRDSRSVIPTKAGFNWENVSKRIIPQLITKGLMLQGERLCTHGMYFVTPEPVFQKISTRLGGLGTLRNLPPQPGAITFVRYEYDEQQTANETIELVAKELSTVSTSDLSLAFISPRNLPPAGSYESKLAEKLQLRPTLM